MTPRVAIVGCGMGNITSLYNAFRAIEADVSVAEAPAALENATHLALPGVGAFPHGMQHLRERGFDDALRRLVVEGGRPLLGVCLGMQLLADVGEEFEPCRGLGLLPGRVVRLEAGGLRLPHIGWNDTVATRPDGLLAASGSVCFYYVHSYHLVPEDPSVVSMRCEYGRPFAAAVQSGHVFGVQFHPEKSHAGGLDVLRRFIQAPC